VILRVNTRLVIIFTVFVENQTYKDMEHRNISYILLLYIQKLVYNHFIYLKYNTNCLNFLSKHIDIDLLMPEYEKQCFESNFPSPPSDIALAV